MAALRDRIGVRITRSAGALRNRARRRSAGMRARPRGHSPHLQGSGTACAGSPHARGRSEAPRRPLATAGAPCLAFPAPAVGNDPEADSRTSPPQHTFIPFVCFRNADLPGGAEGKGEPENAKGVQRRRAAVSVHPTGRPAHPARPGHPCTRSAPRPHDSGGDGRSAQGRPDPTTRPPGLMASAGAPVRSAKADRLRPRAAMAVPTWTGGNHTIPAATTRPTGSAPSSRL